MVVAIYGGLFAASPKTTPIYSVFHGDSQRHLIETHSKTPITQVTLLHPTHPLRGQTFPVLHQSSDEVLIQLPSGQQRFIPLDWTDQVVPPATPAGMRFLLEHLVSLCQRVDALFQKQMNSGTIPPQKDRQAEGGPYGKARSVHVGSTDPGTTRPGDRHFSAADPAPTEQDCGGEAR